MALTVQGNDYLDRFFGFAEVFLCGQERSTDFKLDPLALQKEEENELTYLNACVYSGVDTEPTKLLPGLEKAESVETADETDDEETVEEPTRGRTMSRERSILSRSLSRERSISQKVSNLSRGRSQVRKQENGQARARSLDGWSRLTTGITKAGPLPGWSRVTAGIKTRHRSKTPGRNRRKLGHSVHKVSVPKISMPKVSVPKVKMPKVSVPKIKMPKVSAPKVSLPCKGKAIEDSVVTNTAPDSKC